MASLTDDLADPEQSINERLKILSKDVEEALGVSMETYKIHIVTNLPRAIANRSIEEMVSVNVCVRNAMPKYSNQI